MLRRRGTCAAQLRSDLVADELRQSGRALLRSRFRSTCWWLRIVTDRGLQRAEQFVCGSTFSGLNRFRFVQRIGRSDLDRPRRTERELRYRRFGRRSRRWLGRRWDGWRCIWGRRLGNGCQFGSGCRFGRRLAGRRFGRCRFRGWRFRGRGFFGRFRAWFGAGYRIFGRRGLVHRLGSGHRLRRRNAAVI